MATKQIMLFGDAAGIINADQAGSANSIVYRDSAGGVTNAKSTAASQVSTGEIVAAAHSSTTGTATADATATFWPCDATSAAFNLTLPPVATVTGRIYAVKKTDSGANAVTVKGNAAETIDGANTFALATQYKAVVLISDGTVWHIIGKV